MSDFAIMQKMCDENKDIRMVNSKNVKRTQTGKDGWGEVVIAIPNEVIFDMNNYIFGLYIINKDQFNKMKNADK
jgi:hypothetical protein